MLSIEAAEDPFESTSNPSTPITTSFGDYELLEKIAQGGMGVVYRARQISLQRTVALKMILTARLPGEAEMKRFRAEAEVIARLEHPNIVPIHEIGEDEGRPYFTMKFVPGVSLAGRLATGGWKGDSRANAVLMAKIARAVHHAHQRGILHRDLKPSNILIDEHDEPLVSDFGMAKEVETDSHLTISGAVVGTPAYMAPEQAVGVKTLTTAGDVYSLGAIFYEMLTGRPPFQGNTPLETLRKVTEQEPRRPSSINRHVERDLETICLKCLQKNPGFRYSSAEVLAEDLERWLRHEPILARPITGWERMIKWARRRPAAAALLFLALVAPIAIIVALLVGNARVQKANLETRENLYAADMFLADKALHERNLGLARSALSAYLPAATHATGKNDIRGFEWRLTWQQSQGDQLRVMTGFPRSPTAVAVAPDGQSLAIAGRNFLWRWKLDDPTGVELLPPKEPRWLDDADAARLLAKVRTSPLLTNQVSDTSLGTGVIARWVNPEYIDVVTGLSFSPDGRQVASSARGRERAVRVWNLNDGTAEFAFPTLFGQAAMSPVSQILAVGSLSRPGEPNLGCIKIYDLKQRAETWMIPQVGGQLAFSGNGQVLLTAGWAASDHATRVELWSLPEQRRIQGFNAAKVWSQIALSPDGRWIAAAIWNSPTPELWSVEQGRLVRELAGHAGEIHAVVFSPDSQLLASAGVDQVVRLWSIPSGKLAAIRTGHTDQIESLAFFPDGRRLASAARDGTVRLWSMAITRQETLRSGGGDNVGRMRISPDGRWWTSTSYNWRPSEVSETRVGGAVFKAKVEGERIINQGFDDKGRTLVALVLSGTNAQATLEWRSLDDFTVTRQLTLEGIGSESMGQDLNTDAEIFALGFLEGVIRVWSTRTGKLLRTFEVPDYIDGGGRLPVDLPINCLALSPDGTLLAASTLEHSQIAVFSLPENRLLYSRHIRPLFKVYDAMDDYGYLNSLDFSPDGKMLVTLDKTESAIRLWEPRTGRSLGQLAGHRDYTVGVSFSPDGKTLASTGGDGSLKLWHLPTLREVATPMETGAIGLVAFSPGGNKLIVSVFDGVRIFEVPPLAEIDAQR